DGLSSTIAATSGTIAAPTSLTRGTWGYAIPSGTAHLVSNSFSDSYSTTTSTTPDSSKLFAVPPVASSNPALLASSTSSTSGDTYPVFYAVQANSDTAPGNYTNNIAFTAVADAGSVDKVTVTPSSSNVNASVTMSVDTTLYTTEGFAEANVYLLTATEYNSISGTNVEALGKTPLTCSRTNLAPLSYSCTFTAPSTQDRYYVYVKAPKYNKVYTTTFNTNNPVTLTVNPNGGTWSGSTSTQNFTQNEGTTKTIANPTTGPSYTISYNANGQGAAYSGSPTSVQRPFTSWSKSGGGSISGTTYTFGSTNGALTANYNTTSNSFTLPNITTKNGQNCQWAEGSTSGTKYNGGTSRTITENTTYYAVCPFNGITQMQQMSASICTNAAVNDSTILTDTRDTKTYTVKKLADGNCWMTQNLRLTGSRTLTPADSNVSSDWTLPASTEAYDNTTGATAWCNTSREECYNRANVLDTGNTSYGAYYSWAAATAGTGTYSITSGNVSSSICPKGWRLPTGGSSGEFKTLYDNYNSYDLMTNSSGPAFVLSGFRNGGSTGSQGSLGNYWSSTARANNAAYILSLAGPDVGPSVGPASNKVKYLGHTVRCIAQ
ncbi:hypothetical protein IJH10_00005, partial [Candidatus Saccharibacteria bacterium]|nr:hypothetical protein [Candidatus Saccharibacteria bacterium]